MTSAPRTARRRRERPARPRLVFFTSGVSGRCRRVDGFLAQVLQRRGNHGTFTLVVVDQREQPEMFDRFEIDEVPTLVVVEGRRVQRRLSKPRGCREIETFLAPWLR